MTLPDTNIWLALSLSGHSFHDVARDWFDRQSAAALPLLFCRSTQQSLLRLLTIDAVLRPYGIPPLTNAQAWDVYERFASDRRCGYADEPAGIEATWKRFAAERRASPKLWMDAYLAAFAISGGYTLVTIDTGFAQFKGLNPIILSKP